MLPPSETWQHWVCEQTHANHILRSEQLQILWSGYGSIVRLLTDGGPPDSVILKRITPPSEQNHPRGWNSNRSHERKLRSYEVENHWYQHWASRCDEHCRVPKLIAADTQGEEQWLLMEDLDAAGFAQRGDTLHVSGIEACLRWLASFHGLFLGSEPEGLWPIGTYWHLDTRPDELAAMDDDELRQAAPIIDANLNAARYKTIVHGDAKVANFCFSPDFSRVAAVDFQYVGGGCGMKDVIYFLGSCLSEEACEANEAHYLDYYFQQLRITVAKHHPEIDRAALESEWRQLFPIAWTDFHRFLMGWMPGHWKVNSYSRRLARQVLDSLT